MDELNESSEADAVVYFAPEFAAEVSRKTRLAGGRHVFWRRRQNLRIVEIQRSTRHPNLILDFDCMEPMGPRPLEESYACSVRDHKGISLYFRHKIVARRNLWNDDLEAFIDALDKVTIE